MQRLRDAFREKTRYRPFDHGLDGVNLLLAFSGALYGAFLPVFLASHAWTQGEIGLLLTASTIAGMVFQVPAGLLVDLLETHRRKALALAVAVLALPPLAIALAPRFVPVLLALLLQAAAASLLTPAVSAISLAVAGRSRFADRVGRNSRFGSLGAAAGALAMGLCLDAGSPLFTLLLAAAVAAPTLWAVAAIRPDRVHLSHLGVLPEGAHHALPPEHSAPAGPGRVGWQALLHDRRLLIFALCIAAYALSSSGAMQIVTVSVDRQMGGRSGLAIAAYAILPQIVAATISPAISRASDAFGRRAVLLAGFATLPLRNLLFLLLGSSAGLVPAQLLEGVGGAIFGMMLSLVAADLTRRSGYYTLCLSLLGLAAGLGTAASTTLTGLVSDHFGHAAAFATLAGAGLLALGLVGLLMPETAAPPLAHRRHGTHAD